MSILLFCWLTYRALTTKQIEETTSLLWHSVAMKSLVQMIRILRELVTYVSTVKLAAVLRDARIVEEPEGKLGLAEVSFLTRGETEACVLAVTVSESLGKAARVSSKRLSDEADSNSSCRSFAEGFEKTGESRTVLSASSLDIS